MAEPNVAPDTPAPPAPPPSAPEPSVAATAAPNPVDSGFLSGIPSINIDQYRKDESSLLTQAIGAQGHYAREQASKDREFEDAMKFKFAQESATLDDMKPWNPQTMAPPKTSLWEQFGSPGFVFAMLASSFSAMPMNSALGAGAAAMNAINVGDMEAYDRAFNEWKVNTDLAIKRHNMERDEFQDIGTLWDKDRVAGKARLESYLTQINDKRKLALLRAGMDKETWDAIEGQNRAMEQIVKLQQPMMEQNALIKAVNGDPNYQKDPVGTIAKYEKQLAEAKHPSYGRTAAGVIQTEIDRRNDEWDQNHPDATSDEKNQAHDANARAVVASHNPIGEKRAETADFAAHNKARHDEIIEGLTSKKLTLQEAKNQEDALHKENQDKIAAMKEGREQALAEEKIRHDKAAEEIAKTAKTQLTANKAADLKMMEGRYTSAIDLIDKITNTLKKYTGAVGVAGYAERTAESLSNLVGSNQSDRRQIESWLAELKANATRLVTETTSRPLGVEAAGADKIVRGMGFGDTKVNTTRDLLDLKEQFEKIKKRIEGIRTGAEPAASETKTDTSGGKPEWQRGTVVGE